MTSGHVRRFIESIIGFVSVKGGINDSFIRLMGAVSKSNVFLMVPCYSEGLRTATIEVLYVLFILVWIALNTHEITVNLGGEIRFGSSF